MTLLNRVKCLLGDHKEIWIPDIDELVVISITGAFRERKKSLFICFRCWKEI